MEHLLKKLPNDRSPEEINELCRIFTEDFKIKTMVDMEAQVLRVVCINAIRIRIRTLIQTRI